MPDEVTLDVTTIEENVTVETTAGDVVEIQVVAPTGPAGATGPAGPNSVTSATTSDGTANLTLNNVSTVSFIAGNSSTTSGEITIFTNGPVFQWRSDTVEYGERGFTFLTTDITSEVNYTLPNSSGTIALTANAIGEPDKLTAGTISGATTFNTTSYTYGTGAAAAHRTALGLTTLATTTPGTNVANFLEFPTSANLASALTDETGSGSLVFATSPTLTTPTIAEINGGIAANDDLTLQGTTSATRTTSYVNLQPNGGNVGVGTTTPTQKLDVVGNINIPTTTSTVGIYMINGTRFAHNYGSSNTFIGTGAGNTSFNTTYNGANVGIGTNALSNLNGTAAGQGAFNFGLGSGAGNGITTGSSNILIGNSVGTSITTTSFNTIIGDAAGFGATGLTGVVYLGRGAGRGISTFTDSVFLGTVSGGTTDGGLQTVSSLTNAIAIGARSFVGASHTMALGSVGAYAVDIVSGGSVASAKLHLIKTTEQLRLGYDAANAMKFTVGSANSFTVAPLVDSTTALNFTNAAGTSVFNIDSTNSVVGIGTTTPNAKAKLQVDSTTQGFLPPRMTTTERNAISSPPAGLMIYNTTTNKLNVYTTAWEQITSA